MQLVYRGQVIQYFTQPTQSTGNPRAMSWQYQAADQACADLSLLSAPKHYHPQVMNWRFESVVKH